MSTRDRERDKETKLAISIKAAWAVVEESEVPNHVQELAFKEALRTLLGTIPKSTSSAGNHGAFSTPQVNTNGDPDTVGDDQLTLQTDESVLLRVFEETGVPLDKLEQVFYVDDGVIKRIGQYTRYGSNTTERARCIAQIVTVVRKLGMGQNDTSFAIIKEACASKYCYDSKKFASDHMPNIDGFIVRGEKKNRRIEARGKGISTFIDLIDKILGTA